MRCHTLQCREQQFGASETLVAVTKVTLLESKCINALEFIYFETYIDVPYGARISCTGSPNNTGLQFIPIEAGERCTSIINVFSLQKEASHSVVVHHHYPTLCN